MHSKFLGVLPSAFSIVRSGVAARFQTNAAPRAYQTGYSSSNDTADAPVIIEEVDFDPSLSNSVTLMGNVGKKPELRYFENGNKVANWSIAYKAKRDGETEWYDVEAWGPLAECAAAEVTQGQKIVVQGRLRLQSWTDREGQKRRNIKIVANAVKRVRGMAGGGSPGGDSWQQQQQQQAPTQQQDPFSSSPQQQQQQQQPQQQQSGQPMATTEELWMSFFEDPSGWYDNRPRKVSGDINARSPDFKRKDGGRESPALWIDSRTTPGWVRSELSRLEGLAQQQQQQQDLPPF